MNVLIISQYYYPEPFRINEIAEGLVSQGISTTVLTGIPNYPDGKIYNSYQNMDSKEVINGVNVIRCRIRPRKRGILNLVLNYISYVHYANKKIKKLTDNFDLVFIYQLSPLTMAIPGIKYMNKNGKKGILYCLDLWPESIREISDKIILSEKNIVFKIMKLLSRRIYNQFSLILVKSQYFKCYLTDKLKIQSDKIKVLYEHGEYKFYRINNLTMVKNIFNFYYIGNLGKSQRLKLIIDSFKCFKQKSGKSNIYLHFVGGGSDLDNLKKYTELLKLNDFIKFHGFVPKEEIDKYYEDANCCIISLSDKTLIGKTIPGKFFSSIAAGKPVISVCNGEINDIIQDAKCGFFCTNDDPKEIAKYMEILVNSPTLCEQMSKNAKNYFKDNFTLDIFIKKLIIYMKLLKG